MLKAMQYNISASFPIIFPRNCFTGEIPEVVSGGNVRRGMKYPGGNSQIPAGQTNRLKY